MGDLEEVKRLLGEVRDHLNGFHVSFQESYGTKEDIRKLTDALPLLDNMEELEALKEPPTNYGTCGCHSVPGDSKTCKVHTDRDYYFFLQGLEAGKETMMEPSAEEPKIPSDEFFDDAKRHEMELMGGAPEHLMDRAVPSIQKMMNETKKSEKEGSRWGTSAIV